jgi:hypothetical protein
MGVSLFDPIKPHQRRYQHEQIRLGSRSLSTKTTA